VFERPKVLNARVELTRTVAGGNVRVLQTAGGAVQGNHHFNYNSNSIDYDE